MVNAVRYEIEHVSRYRYAFQAQRCTMLLCLKPDNDRGQRLLDFEIQTVPPAFLNQETDCFGNRRHVLNLHSEHQTLEITARSTVEPAFLAPLPQPVLAPMPGKKSGPGKSPSPIGNSSIRARWPSRHRFSPISLTEMTSSAAMILSRDY